VHVLDSTLSIKDSSVIHSRLFSQWHELFSWETIWRYLRWRRGV